MKLLALDTSEDACSVALFIDGKSIEQYQLAPKAHTQYVLPFIQSLLSQAGLALSQIDVLAFGKGPGSFTGLRIASGVIQGLAYALDLPVVPVSTLQALAESAYRQFRARYVIAVQDARMNQIYWGLYQLNNRGQMGPIERDHIADPTTLDIPTAFKKNHLVGIGSGWRIYREILRQKLDKNIPYYPEEFVHAEDIAKIAVNEFQQGHFVEAKDALPVYLHEW